MNVAVPLRYCKYCNCVERSDLKYHGRGIIVLSTFKITHIRFLTHIVLS